MAISTTLATPETLVEDQELSILDSKTDIKCWNDSAFKSQHYRTIPNDNSNEGSIKWGNVKSVKRPDGDYAISVSMWEYIPDAVTHPFFGTPRNLFLELMNASKDGSKVNMPDRGDMYIMPDSVYLEQNTGHVIFRKLVWVRNSDLILGSVAQQQAMTDAEKLKKQQEIDALFKTDPITGNTQNPSKITNTTWLIIGVLFFFVFGTIALFKALKNKREKENQLQNQNPINVIRIPKNE